MSRDRTMIALDKIYSALNDGLAAAESLLTWQTGGDGYRLALHRIDSARLGLSAYKLIAEEMSKRPYRPEPEYYEPPTSCYCSATSHPPCSFCESGKVGEGE